MATDPPVTPERPALWDMDSADYECDCPGPPPPFRLPPPPRPPFLQGSDCSESPLVGLETCDAVPVIDAEYHSNPVIPSIAVIVVCSVLLLAMVLIATVLVWKHKRKMQNFLPCKASPAPRCDVPLNGNGVIYEDLTNMRPRAMANHCSAGQTLAPSIEMIDVKSGGAFNIGFHPLGNSSVFICTAPRSDGPDPYSSQDLYNPVYEELSNGSGDRGDSDPESEGVMAGHHSEDEFAEDELSLGGDVDHPPLGPDDDVHLSGTSSLQGSTGNDLCRDVDSSDADDRSRFLQNNAGRNFSLPPGYRNRSRGTHQQRGPPHPPPTSTTTTDPRRLRSLDRRRGWRNKPQPPPVTQTSPLTPRRQDCGEFHEGLLLDALLQMYPNVVGTNRPVRNPNYPPPVPSVAHRLPYIMPPMPVPSPPQPSRNIVNPYESVPVLTHLHHHHHNSRPESMSSFRPVKGHSQDSSFGSDSGYSNSNNTAGRRGGHKDSHSRLSGHSGDLVIS